MWASINASVPLVSARPSCSATSLTFAAMTHLAGVLKDDGARLTQPGSFSEDPKIDERGPLLSRRHIP
jgi:hypothetical protein